MAHKLPTIDLNPTPAGLFVTYFRHHSIRLDAEAGLEQAGKRAQGQRVGLAAADVGAIWLADDRAGQIIRIAFDGHNDL